MIRKRQADYDFNMDEQPHRRHGERLPHLMRV
jgi:hypothetical protein